MNMPQNLRAIVQAILEDYALPWDGPHGVAHWARVLENGLRLAEVTGADLEVVALFAVFHDSKRINERRDAQHGQRGAAFASQLRGRVFELADPEFALLLQACRGHTDERTHPDITVQTCWDADRLDLGRVGIKPDPIRLCTVAARQAPLLKWADGRARLGVVPGLVQEAWGIDVKTRYWPDAVPEAGP